LVRARQSRRRDIVATKLGYEESEGEI